MMECPRNLNEIQQVIKMKDRFSGNVDDLYTEDGVLVRRIYIPEIPDDNVSLLSMWNRFAEFGEIEDVALKKNRLEIYGLVTFVNSKDAAKALKYYGGRPAVEQPPTANRGTCGYHLYKKINEYTVKGNERNSLMRLNDDCLLHLFSFLNLFALMNMENVCSRFAILVNLFCYKHHRVLNMNSIVSDKDKTLTEKEFVLMRIGKYINDIQLFGSRVDHMEHFADPIAKYCNNLEVIRFSRLRNLDDKLMSYLPLFEKLKKISLKECELSESVLDKCFERSESLEELELTRNSKLTGRCIIRLYNLKKLSIESCSNFRSAQFAKFCINNNTLKYLNVINCKRLLESNFVTHIQKLINLEYLAINDESKNFTKNDVCKLAKLNKLKKVRIQDSSNDFLGLFISELVIKDQLESIDIRNVTATKTILHMLSKFKNLKELTITHNDDITDDDLSKIATRGILTRLQINFCKNVTNAGLLSCIKLCPNLEYLDVFGFAKLNDEFILLLPFILMDRKIPKQLTIVLYKHKFDVFFKNNQSFLLENKYLFRVLFREGH